MSRVSSVISEQRDTAHEQLAAAWQQIRNVFDDRFAELAERARRETAEEFSRAVRRLQQCKGEEQWGAALLESIQGYCSHAVLLIVRDQVLRGLNDGLELPLTAAPAAAAVVASRDSLVTVTTAGEISPELSAFFERAGAANCAIVPVPARERVAAVLLAAGDGIDVSALEALAGLAGTALDAPARSSQPSEDALHLRAQRFARVRAAEIRLYKSQAVRDGRARKKLYTELKEEIDSARTAYAREFLHASSSMPDYLHLELLRTLANDEVAALGEEYPGPLA